MKHLKTASKLFLVMTLLTGIIYPLFITLVAQLFMADLADGSLAHKDGRVIGSYLLAQKTTAENYFWPRPSAIGYNPLGPSGGSNLGPTSQKLKEIIAEKKKQFGAEAPSDLLYASGSGLDPHITVQAAYYQIPRVSKARNLTEENLKELIDSFLEKRQINLLGPYFVNVLRLNQALDDGR